MQMKRQKIPMARALANGSFFLNDAFLRSFTELYKQIQSFEITIHLKRAGVT